MRSSRARSRGPESTRGSAGRAAACVPRQGPRARGKAHFGGREWNGPVESDRGRGGQSADRIPERQGWGCPNATEMSALTRSSQNSVTSTTVPSSTTFSVAGISM